MADYYPLLARALESLPDTNPDARKVVYERAKAALVGQLQNVKPPLGEDAIQREVDSLDDAISRIERVHKAPPTAPAAAPKPDAADSAIQRPKVDGTQIRRGGKRGRSLLTAIGLVAVIVPIGVAAWLWRDRPAQPVTTTPTASQPAAPPANADPKFPERVGGAAPAQDGTPAAPARETPPAAGTPAPAAGPPTATPGLAVAQKAALVEENTEDPKQPKMTAGRAFWRLDIVNAGQGQPLESVVHANVEVPEAGMSLQLVMKRNRDTALPASHTLELSFTTPAGDAGRAVRDVNPPLLRGDDGARGVPVAALSVPVKENLFLIGLSDLKGDLERNSDLLRNRNWVEIPLRFASGQRATLVFEKGVAGERVMADAWRAWSQP